MIIIVTPSYNEGTGGRIVLHLLGKLLRDMSYDVALSPFKCHEKKFVNPHGLPLVRYGNKDDVVIYPKHRP